MRYGLALPHNAARIVADQARAAEAAGWDGIFLGDAVWCEDPIVALTAAAMVTERIQLGTRVVPVPLRTPWKIASEAVALDRLSRGRLILGLGTGAVWMGWQAFPAVQTETRARAEMLDETIDILDGLFRRRPFDYEGQHYRVLLTRLDPAHYPPPTVKQPRVPLWAVGIWPRRRSMRRVLKCDGLIVEKQGPGGEPEEPTPDDVRAVRDFVAEGRPDGAPFDIVVAGKTDVSDPERARERVAALREAGATWWIEDLWGVSDEAIAARLERRGWDLPRGR